MFVAAYNRLAAGYFCVILAFARNGRRLKTENPLYKCR